MRHRNWLLDSVRFISAIIAICISLLLPEWTLENRYIILAASMLLVGIPHGALDHIVSDHLFNLNSKPSDRLKFYMPYLVLLLIMGLIWIWSPFLGFIIFFLITIYHFGEADVTIWNLPKKESYILSIIRGTWVLSLIIFSDFEYTTYLIQQVTMPLPFDPAEAELIIFPVLVALSTVYLAVTVFFFLTYSSRQSFSYFYLLSDFIILGLLFYYADPIIAFTVYFITWHSFGHAKLLKDFFEEQGIRLTLQKFYKMSLPFTAISLLGLVILYILLNSFGSMDVMVTLLFILISVLTLPHALVVTTLLTKKKPGDNRASANKSSDTITCSVVK